MADSDDHTSDDDLPASLPETKLGLALLALAMSAPGMPPQVQAAATAVAIVPAFLDYLQGASARTWSRVGSMSEAAVEEYPGGAEAFLERLAQDERLLWMLDTSVDAAARTQTEQHARVIGRALRSGALAADDAQIDEAAQKLRIVADLEGADWRVLEVMAHLPQAAKDSERGIRVDELTTHTRGLSEISVRCALAVLERHGLVGHWSHWGDGWYATPLAKDFLTYVHDAGGLGV